MSNWKVSCCRIAIFIAVFSFANCCKPQPISSSKLPSSDARITARYCCKYAANKRCENTCQTSLFDNGTNLLDLQPKTCNVLADIRAYHCIELYLVCTKCEVSANLITDCIETFFHMKANDSSFEKTSKTFMKEPSVYTCVKNYIRRSNDVLSDRTIQTCAGKLKNCKSPLVVDETFSYTRNLADFLEGCQKTETFQDDMAACFDFRQVEKEIKVGKNGKN